MRALAQKAIARALDDDHRKATVNSDADNIKAAQIAVQQRRLPSALLFALKAAEKKQGDAHNVVGEVLLDLRLPSSAAAAITSPANTPGLRTAVNHAAVLAALHTPNKDVSAACEAARKLSTEKQKLELARIQATAGDVDEALESAQAAMHGLTPGDVGLNHATVLAAEMELAMYSEAAWPQCAVSRPERRQDKQAPQGVHLPAWRLQRGIEVARTHGRRVPQCVGASVLAAEMLLEGHLYRELLMPWATPAAQCEWRTIRTTCH